MNNCDPDNPKPVSDNLSSEPADLSTPLPEKLPPDDPYGVPLARNYVLGPEKKPIRVLLQTPPEGSPKPARSGPMAFSRPARLSPRTAGTLLVAALLSSTLLAHPVAAQSSNDHSHEPSATERCQAEPGMKGESEPDGPSSNGGLSAEMLRRCDGVLEPPPTGDSEIEELAPDTGTTPVIPPERVPEQQPG